MPLVPFQRVELRTSRKRRQGYWPRDWTEFLSASFDQGLEEKYDNTNDEYEAALFLVDTGKKSANVMSVEDGGKREVVRK